METLGNFEQLVLFAVLRLGDDAYGDTIRETLEANTGRAVSSGAIYTALGRMEDRGLVTSKVGEAEGRGRPRKYYALEKAGARALLETYSTVRTMAGGLIPRLSSLVEE